jgi:hypothetical protein
MLLEKVGEIIVESRNSGIQTINDIIVGEWMPKTPDDIENDVLNLINSLCEKQKKELLNVIRYSVDLSFFKLLSSLEMGECGLDFTLSATDEKGNSIALINDSEDIGLRTKFFSWVKDLGI